MTFATEYFALTGERLSRPIIEEIYEGLPISAADVVQSSLSLTTFEACKLLHCSQSTLKRKDFRFCIELPVLVKFKKYKLISRSSYERSRLSGKKKVNELKDGFLILLCILTMFIIKK